MCGIIAVIGRPADRTHPPSRESRPSCVLRRATSPPCSTAASRHPSWSRRSPRRPARRARRRRAPRDAGRADAPRPARRHRRAGRPAWSTSRAPCGALEAQLDDDGRGSPPAELEVLNAELVRREGRALGDRGATGCAPPRPSATSPARRRDRRGARRVPGRPGGAVGDRPARGAGPRLRRHPHPRRATTALDLADPDRRAGCSRSGPTTRCSVRRRCALPDGDAELRLQGGGRDRRARRQHRARSAARSRADELLRLALANDDRPGRRARPHPLGERRDHLRGQRAPAERRGASSTAAARPVRRPPRSTATSTTTPTSSRIEGLRIAAGDHHRRQGHPGARRPAASSRAPTLDEAFRAHGRRRSRARSRSRANVPRRARPRPARAARAAGRRSTSASPRTPSSSRASRTGSSRRRARYLRLDGETPADPEQPGVEPRPDRACSTASAPGRSTGSTRSRYDGTDAAGRRATSSQHAADHHPRHRPRRRSPHYLLKEITRGAGVVPQDAARARSSSATARSAVELGARDPSDRRCGRGCASGAIRRVLVIGQGTAAVAGQSLAAALRARSGRSAPRRRRGGPGDRAVRASGSCADMSDTLVVAISQSGTTTDTNRTVDLVRDRGAAVSRSSTGATATSSTGPTACSTPPTGATWR